MLVKSEKLLDTQLHLSESVLQKGWTNDLPSPHVGCQYRRPWNASISWP